MIPLDTPENRENNKAIELKEGQDEVETRRSLADLLPELQLMGEVGSEASADEPTLDLTPDMQSPKGSKKDIPTHQSGAPAEEIDDRANTLEWDRNAQAELEGISDEMDIRAAPKEEIDDIADTLKREIGSELEKYEETDEDTLVRKTI